MTLIEKLEAATEGSRALDAELAETIDFRDPKSSIRWRNIVSSVGYSQVFAAAIPHFTTSIDASLTLVPEGWTYTIYQRSRDMYGVHLAADTHPNHSASGPTAPLAVCIAALKAREAQP